MTNKIQQAKRQAVVKRLLAVLAVVFVVPTAATGQEAGRDAAEAALQKKYERAVQRGVEFLSIKGQSADGSYSGSTGMGVTALATTAILQHGRSPADPVVARSLAYLQKFVHPDGGVYRRGSLYRNYETSLALLCFRAANADGRYDKLIKRADGFLKGIQVGAEDDKDRGDPAFGGAGYGKHKRPDLSNTSFLIDALRAAGNDEESEALQRALIFVSRCQNLESEHNTTPFSAKNPDGGFYYTPAAGGTSQAGKTPNGGLRSYGSMTYAGLKSMIYAGVATDDPRVVAALEWIGKHYDLSNNPGLGNAGLFYYYHTFAKALDALGQDTFVDHAGKRHNWRAELTAELAARQQADGSWINENARWMEGDANLVTAYALLALSYAKPKDARSARKE